MTDQIPKKRTCAGTRKDGQACNSTVTDPNGYCFAHGRSPKQVSANARRAAERSAEVRREQVKSVRDRLRERVEEQFELIWSALRDGLEAVGSDGDPDARTRISAAQAVLAEAYGRPAQATKVELTGVEDAPVQMEVAGGRITGIQEVFELARAFGAGLGAGLIPGTPDSPVPAITRSLAEASELGELEP